MVIYRAAMRQEYPSLATDTGVNSYFTIYYNSEIVYTKYLDDFFMFHISKSGRQFFF